MEEGTEAVEEATQLLVLRPYCVQLSNRADEDRQLLSACCRVTLILTWRRPNCCRRNVLLEWSRRPVGVEETVWFHRPVWCGSNYHCLFNYTLRQEAENTARFEKKHGEAVTVRPVTTSAYHTTRSSLRPHNATNSVATNVSPAAASRNTKLSPSIMSGYLSAHMNNRFKKKDTSRAVDHGRAHQHQPPAQHSRQFKIFCLPVCYS
jgi:hypothetical protein